MTSLPEQQWRKDLLIDLPLKSIRLGRQFARRRPEALDNLMTSIAQYGLLRNLIVTGPGKDGLFEVYSGERRFRALQMMSSLRGTPGDSAPCFVLTDGCKARLPAPTYELPIWEAGCVYINYLAAGYTQRELAARIGKSQAHVSSAINLARRLSPMVIARLQAPAGPRMSTYRLLDIAALQHDSGEPNERAQLELFEEMRAQPRARGRPPRARTESENLWRRFQLLKRGESSLSVDPVFKPFLERVINYLSGAPHSHVRRTS